MAVGTLFARCSNMRGVLKQAQATHALALVVSSEDDVVNYGYVDCFGGADKRARSFTVRGAGCRIATRMIVGQQDPAAAQSRCVGDDFANRQIDAALMAVRVATNVDAAGALVDMCDPKPLAIGIGAQKACREEIACGVMASK